MSNIGKIKVRAFTDLVERKETAIKISSEDDVISETPQIKKLNIRSRNAATTSRKARTTAATPKEPETPTPSGSISTTVKKWSRTTKKDLDNQMRIDNFFKSALKTYKVDVPIEIIQTAGKENQGKTNRKSKALRKSKRKKGRKLDFNESSESDNDSDYIASPPNNTKSKQRSKSKRNQRKTSDKDGSETKQTAQPTAIIDLCSESDNCPEVEAPDTIQRVQSNLIKEENSVSVVLGKECENQAQKNSNCPLVEASPEADLVASQDTIYMEPCTPAEVKKRSLAKLRLKNSSRTPSCAPSQVTDILDKSSQCKKSRLSAPQDGTCVVQSPNQPMHKEIIDEFEVSPKVAPTIDVQVTAPSTGRRRKPKPLPPYKVIDGTNFAVDAFQFGYINAVTHYFLSHFHADHYIGLTQKFAMPLYVSRITANLIRAFIPIDEEYLYEMELNQPIVIDNVEVTAIDANHCPGAVMFVFKLSSGRCILHTGDFRACPDMESEPIFWNNDIDTIYLDTTYLSDKYAFCTQYESIDNAKMLVNDFQNKHVGKRILYVCGSYLIGKEKFWAALAHEYNLRVWPQGNRKKSLLAIQDANLLRLICDNPLEADMHIIPLGKLSYMCLVDYFQEYTEHYDIMLALRPSGWEKNSRPQYRGFINIIGIEYSEHSSYTEMQRFVSYIKPREVISTVPVGRDLMRTGKVPLKWYKYEKLTGQQKNFQPSITNYLKPSTPKITPLKQNDINVSPMKHEEEAHLTSKVNEIVQSVEEYVDEDWM